MGIRATRDTGRGRRLGRPCRWLRTFSLAALVAGCVGLTAVAGANAGTYVIDNCPSAGNEDAGAWTVFGSPQNVKGTCSAGPGDFIGPRGGSMSPGSLAGVQIGVPAGSGITITEAKIWWQVSHQTSGADTFAIAADNVGAVDESLTPLASPQPSTFVLPSTTTELTLANYCSNDDAGAGCTFGSGENNILELYGAHLTLKDTTLPKGTVTGGDLSGSASVSGTASISYQGQDTSSGVRLVQLEVDGEPAAQKDYMPSCSYTSFQACPPSVSDTIDWNTATVSDGQHNVQLTVEDAAQNTSTIYDGTITTQNAPSSSSSPSITGGAEPLPGSTLSAQTGEWSAPLGAGNISYAYQWQWCSGEGEDCETIAGAQGASYNPTRAEVGHTLRVRVTATDSDGSTSLQSEPSGAVESLTQTGQQSLETNTLRSIGTPNGTNASETAQVHLATQTRITRTFADRALTITGQLTNPAGTPIIGATLDIHEQAANSSSNVLIGHTSTGANGSFTAHVAAGPSRLVTIAYRAFSSDAGYAAQAGIQEIVGAEIHMRITPLRTSSTGTIALSGQVEGPIPRGGVLVELLVYYRGAWVPFRTPRTNAGGRFSTRYEFQGATGRYPFRAEAPGGQVGFPYAAGSSPIIAVRTG